MHQSLSAILLVVLVVALLQANLSIAVPNPLATVDKSAEAHSKGAVAVDELIGESTGDGSGDEVQINNESSDEGEGEHRDEEYINSCESNDFRVLGTTHVSHD